MASLAILFVLDFGTIPTVIKLRKEKKTLRKKTDMERIKPFTTGWIIFF